MFTPLPSSCFSGGVGGSLENHHKVALDAGHALGEKLFGCGQAWSKYVSSANARVPRPSVSFLCRKSRDVPPDLPVRSREELPKPGLHRDLPFPQEPGRSENIHMFWSSAWSGGALGTASPCRMSGIQSSKSLARKEQ